MLNGIIAFVSWRLERHMLARDPRRQRIAVVFWVMIFFAVLAVLELITYVAPFLLLVFLPLALVLPFSVVVLVALLIGNGVKNIRKEGISPGNSLALLAGVALLALPVVGLFLLRLNHPISIAAAMLLFFASAQVGLSFLVFYTFHRLYARTRPRPDPDAVVVLGSGLRQGQVPPLLRARLDLGLAQFARVRASGHPAVLIPSGGQGPDEPRAEAEAMAEYLRERGVPADELAPEVESRNTEQNLKFSVRVVDQWRQGQLESEHRVPGLPATERQDIESPGIESSGTEQLGIEQPGAEHLDDEEGFEPGRRQELVTMPQQRLEVTPEHTGATATRAHRPAHLLVVTNGYHVPRAALLSRRLGVSADVVGAATARYFVPSAFLREFVGVVVMNKRLHVVWALFSILVSVLIAWALLAR